MRLGLPFFGKSAETAPRGSKDPAGRRKCLLPVWLTVSEEAQQCHFSITCLFGSKDLGFIGLGP